MHHYELKYGRQQLRVEWPDLPDAEVEVCRNVQRATTQADEKEIVLSALHRPVQSSRLSHLVKRGERVCIVTSDNTRPMPTPQVLPLVLDELNKGGVRARDILVVFALGIHRQQSDEERRELLGPAVEGDVLCVDSDPEDTTFLGRTRFGTPVHMYRPVAEADRLICLGNVEFHYFAGYSGGGKAILPGVCDARTVTHNHGAMVADEAAAGKLAGNPVREDIDSVLDLRPIDFIVNVAVSDQGRITYAAAGDPIAAHRKVCAHVDRTHRSGRANSADLVLASAGGHPKDINLYQTQKAIDFACQFAAAGAPVLCVGECSEGYGNDVFASWLQQGDSPSDIAQRLMTKFELGGHKAFALARSASAHTIGMASSLPEEYVRSAFLHPVSIADDQRVTVPVSFSGLARKNSHGCSPRIAVLPNAPSTLPRKK